LTHVAITVFNTVFDCCWFLCILLVCDICCLCGLINTLINDCIGLLSCWLLQQSLCHCTRYYYCRHCHYLRQGNYVYIKRHHAMCAEGDIVMTFLSVSPTNASTVSKRMTW